MALRKLVHRQLAEVLDLVIVVKVLDIIVVAVKQARWPINDLWLIILIPSSGIIIIIILSSSLLGVP